MASTAHKTEEEKKEYFDTEEELDKKIEILASLILQSEHFIAFTGAGISTASGIPDFRSGMQTVLQTGPGAWEKQAQNHQPKQKYQTVSMLKALPTYTHMALLKLEQLGFLKFLISQNVDGLHRRSGFPPEKLAELHGNTNLEKCDKCGKEFLRDYRVRTAQQVHDHKTGRKCDNCFTGLLHDSIINFGENLPQKDLDDGFMHSQISDLCLVLGSSLRVTPAADMPACLAKDKNKNLVIVNIQLTPLDDLCTLRIFALCDKVMQKLMKVLSIEVQEFKLTRLVQIVQTESKLIIQGIDTDDCPYSFIKELYWKQGNTMKMLNKEPFQIDLNQQIQEVQTKLHFFGHYEEPDLNLNIPLLNIEKNEKKRKFLLEYNPFVKQWVNICEL